MGFRPSEDSKPSILSRLSSSPWLLVMIAVAVALRLVLILLVSPTSDVYYYDTQAAEALLAGSSPYAHVYTNIPPRLITPGAERVFAYLPFTALYLVPFRLLGDVRIGFILADVTIAVSLYLTTEKRVLKIAGVYLFTPFVVVFSTIYINNTVISMLFLALFFYFEKEGGQRQRWTVCSSLCLGIALASIQFAWLILPAIIFYLFRAGRFREIGLALIFALLIMLPFAVLDFNSLYSETISFQFSRPTLQVVTLSGPIDFSLASLLNINLNFSINGLLLTLAGSTLPLWLRVGSVAVFLASVLRRVKDLRSLVYWSGVFLLVTLFVLPNNFFFPYIELPFLGLLAYLAASSSEPLNA